MATIAEDAKKAWNSGGTWESINAGNLQRIADAVEKMSGSYAVVINERDYYQGQYRAQIRKREEAERTIRALRGVITKMKRKAGEDR